MPNTSRPNTARANSLHPRNLHQGRYDFNVLSKANPKLATFVRKNPKGQKTIDFSNATAVIELNKALLHHFYQIKDWQLPDGFLCPPIPGRADYIHYAADLLAELNQNKVTKGKQVKVVDIGTGANLVYPIIGAASYGWQFIASEVNQASYQAALGNIQRNDNLQDAIQLIKQSDSATIFNGIIEPNAHICLTLCNPPFHASAKEAQAGTQRKNTNLNLEPNKKNPNRATLNFGGQHNELWCKGGELSFIKRMIRESKGYGQQVAWFTCLVSKKESLNPINLALKKASAHEVKVVKMAQGQKISRFVAWTFLSKEQRQSWLKDIAS